ncbi:hypothetical protein P3T36_006906 [Kitasatospora sp. MAP12-15]|uniref:hypothetical protein n=1 Tax=unclassified Kitasatospora TaxID=2633591 RepID=UPI002473C94E|nr:hypothetical protein [Kitasatospora sp. MAP12-44]MDH6111911.1 hypothetical protein [Kitasatospora sp. MAP12-44]
MQRINSAVDRLLAAVEQVSISRWHILALLFLGIGLLTEGSDQAFESVGGNYTNVISATVSLLVLAEQKAAEQRHTNRHEDLKQHVTTQKETL